MIPSWLPDWTNEAAYPDPENTSRVQWAWEFLRRNPEYQRDYNDVKNFRTYEKYIKAYDYMSSKYGIGGFRDPSKDSLDSPYFFSNSNPPKHTGKSSAKEVAAEIGKNSPIQYYRFDLRQPIKPQIEYVRKALRWRQKELRRIGVLETEHREHLKKYQSYLRVLDGDSRGAPIADMANIIFGLVDIFPNKQAYERVSSSLTAGELLRDHDYRNIPLP